LERLKRCYQPFQALPLERLKRFSVSQRRSNVSAVPSVTLGTAETLLKFAKILRRFSRPSITLGTAETFHRFAKTVKHFGRSKRHAWNGRNVAQVSKNIKTYQPFQALPLERLKRFSISQRRSNVSSVPSVTLGTAETLLTFAKTLNRFSRSKRYPWNG